MNLLDIILSIILIFAFFRGMKKGLFVTLASLAGLVLGVYGAVYFSDFAAGYLFQWFDWNEQTINLVAFAITFFVIVYLVSIAGNFLTKMLDFAFLGIFNKLLGGMFNTLIIAFIISVIFMFFDSWNPTSYVIPEEKKENSYLYEPVASLAPMVIPYILKEVDEYKKENENKEN
jgi:membrane protein required for colicin V production